VLSLPVLCAAAEFAIGTQKPQVYIGGTEHCLGDVVHDLIRQLPKYEDDGRLVRTVGDWGAQKYLLALRYAEIVTTAMKGKWSRAYIDLFCGSGLVRLEDSRRWFPARRSSPSP
jgi:hypothetical protein